ncbi:MAG: alpha/beta hydrolase, partial [Candidatus Acidiferrales bacterium]
IAVCIAAAMPALRAQQSAPATPAAAASQAAAPVPPGVELVHDNLVYGLADGQTLLLDVYEPPDSTGAPRPAVILLHGGGWTSFDKSTMHPLARFLALSGFVTVTVDYRLYHDNANRWPAQLDDVQRAVRWVRANAAKYNVDPEHIGAYGHSAGAQLALLLGMVETRDNSDAALAKYSSKVEAVVEASGPTDLTAEHDAPNAKFLADFLGADYETHPEVWRDASPVWHAAKSNAPILIIHGTRDQMVPVAQAAELDAALVKAGADVKFLQLESDHTFQEPAARRELAMGTLAFFNQYLRGAGPNTSTPTP